MKQIRNKIRQEIGKDYQPTLTHKIEYLNPLLRGWSNYYNWLNSASHFKSIDRYVATKLNKWNRIKHGAKGRKYRWISQPGLYKQGLYRLGGKIAYV